MTASGRRPPLILLVLATAIGGLSMNIFIPSMPGLVRAFATDIATVQLTLTLYLAGIAVGQLVYGPLSDHYGRRPMMLAGLGLYALAALVASLAQTIDVLILGRIAQAFGGCAGMVITRAIIRDVYDRDRAASVLGYVTMAMTVAPAMAPVLGGYLDLWFSWRAGLWVLSGYGIALFLGCLFYLNETLKEPQPTIGVLPILHSYRMLLRRPAFLGYAFGVGLSTACFFAFLAGAPYLMIEVLKRPPSDYGIWFVIVSLGYFIGNFLTGRLSGRLGVDRMVTIGAAMVLSGGLGMLAHVLTAPLAPYGIFLPAMMVAMGNGVGQPNGIAGAISVDPTRAGAASGIVGFLQMSIGAVGTVIIGHTLESTLLPVALTVTALGSGSALFFWLALLRRPGLPGPADR
ncbi:MAG: Bcr/CflA family efflux MFS transporter [Alphaproteobacteria bacterium]|nr:Bcr/CflA family efflux MFS transporter [Alphaproteobacteria bacterium]